MGQTWLCVIVSGDICHVGPKYGTEKEARPSPHWGISGVQFSVNPDYLEDVDEWRREETGNLSRSQAMRELVLKSSL
jgi:hypothetical protein